jgi:hypothetical protein
MHKVVQNTPQWGQPVIRFFALLGLQFLVNFALLGENPIVSHPVHHDDYSVLASRLGNYSVQSPRPLSGLVIATLGSLGREATYVVQNLLLVACVFLCLRFAELTLRNGRPLPTLGFLAAGVIALAFPAVVDWTKYLGLLTNLSSALFGLSALCVAAKLHHDATRASKLAPWILLLAALSFLAKEDFILPLLLVAASFAIIGPWRLWIRIGGTLAVMYGAILVFNLAIGSVFVSGMKGPDDPYFMSLAPVSMLRAYGQWLFDDPFQLALSAAVCIAALGAIATHRRDRALAIRIACLVLVPLGLLAPYSIFPNHIFFYYAFLPSAMLAALLAGALYAIAEVRDGI